jgi:hypothetical protein
VPLEVHRSLPGTNLNEKISDCLIRALARIHEGGGITLVSNSLIGAAYGERFHATGLALPGCMDQGDLIVITYSVCIRSMVEQKNDNVTSSFSAATKSDVVRLLVVTSEWAPWRRSARVTSALPPSGDHCNAGAWISPAFCFAFAPASSSMSDQPRNRRSVRSSRCCSRTATKQMTRYFRFHVLRCLGENVIRSFPW